ncbi:hypothetical protein ACFVWN_01175 [Nocardiopsis flavescens]|uniref:hypothetical protein n=1 Tax=Nocardiopsis flavescens TaxID=758803 RepID=UPI00364653B3
MSTPTHQELRCASRQLRHAPQPMLRLVSTWLAAHAADHTNPALSEPGGCPAAPLVAHLLTDAEKQEFHFVFAMRTGAVIVSGPNRYTDALAAADDARRWMGDTQRLTLDTYTGGAAVIRGGEIEHTAVLTPEETQEHVALFLTPPGPGEQAVPEAPAGTESGGSR